MAGSRRKRFRGWCVPSIPRARRLCNLRNATDTASRPCTACLRRFRLRPAFSTSDAGGGGLFLNCLAVLGRIRSGHGFDAPPPAIRVARAAAARLGGSGSRVLPSFDVRRVEQGLREGTFDVVLLRGCSTTSPKQRASASSLRRPTGLPGGPRRQGNGCRSRMARLREPRA